MFTRFLHKTPSGVRHEIKYVINSGVCEILRRRCAAVMQTDKHASNGGYRVTSLYFDDVYGTAYNDKLTGILKRKKFRIRAYNLSPDRITLEGKYKEGDYIKKKSAILTLEEYKAIISGGAHCASAESPANSAEIIQDFRSDTAMHGLKPAVITDYYREAFTAEAGNVRITFDKNLQTGFGSCDMFEATYSPVKDFYNQAVLEIKYDRFLPSYIQELFSGFPLMSKPVSKYILCANQILEVNKTCLLSIN
jgi:hypothetical protein